MRLAELQACCDEFLVLDRDDRFTVRLRVATGDHVEPALNEHRVALFVWLRQWGCRQFARRDEALSHESLLAWWSSHGSGLPDPGTHLHALDDVQLDSIADAYESLRNRVAAHQMRQSGAVAQRFGPTGAAKALHAIRPRSCAPWDLPIRNRLGLPDTAEGYLAHLRRIRQELADAARDLPSGLGIADIPEAIGRPGISPVKLADEHDWVRFTRGFVPAST